MRRSNVMGLVMIMTLIGLTLLGAKAEAWVSYSIKSRIISGQPAYVLLLGVDARPGEIRARTDTIMLAGIDRRLGKAALLSIPRDTRIAYYGPMRKINMVNQIEGPEATCQETGKLLGIEIDHYILTNFQGFERIVDLLGGIDVEVEFDLSSPSTNTYIARGQQHLNGKQALLYARYRDVNGADIGRTARQQKLMLALYRRFMQVDIIPRLPEMIKELQNNIETNVSLGDLLFTVRLLNTIHEDNIVTQTLPGHHHFDPYTGASYWEVDQQVARSIMPSLFRGHVYDVYQQSP